MRRLVLLIIVSVLCAACTHERTNRTLTSYGAEAPEWTEATSELPVPVDEETQVKQELAETAKKSHGLMHIHRFGPGFDVLLTLDAGDSDVAFTMSLPSDRTGFSDRDELTSEEQSEDTEYEEKLEELDEEKALLHQEEFEERNELAEQKRSQDFHAATRHILNAQSLFYKKQYWQSLDEANEALDLIPDSAQAHALKGSIYYRMGLLSEAEVSWRKALDIDPGMEQVRASLARLKQQ